VHYGEKKMDIEEIANATCENLLPPKSQKRYEGTIGGHKKLGQT
jgi:hypothetical protein